MASIRTSSPATAPPAEVAIIPDTVATVDPAGFRTVMSSVCTPVGVVTVAADAGPPHGATVSSFTSLSLDPPMVMVALDRRSQTLTRLRDRGRFGLNVLAGDQSALARVFAGPDPDRFGHVAWAIAAGVPVLAGVAAWLACDLDRLVDGGDHLIVLGHVRAAGHRPDAAPLTYHRRRFGTRRDTGGP